MKGNRKGTHDKSNPNASPSAARCLTMSPDTAGSGVTSVQTGRKRIKDESGGSLGNVPPNPVQPASA